MISCEKPRCNKTEPDTLNSESCEIAQSRPSQKTSLSELQVLPSKEINDDEAPLPIRGHFVKNQQKTSSSSGGLRTKNSKQTPSSSSSNIWGILKKMTRYKKEKKSSQRSWVAIEVVEGPEPGKSDDGTTVSQSGGGPSSVGDDVEKISCAQQQRTDQVLPASDGAQLVVITARGVCVGGGNSGRTNRSQSESGIQHPLPPALIELANESVSTTSLYYEIARNEEQNKRIGASNEVEGDRVSAVRSRFAEEDDDREVTDRQDSKSRCRAHMKPPNFLQLREKIIVVQPASSSGAVRFGSESTRSSDGRRSVNMSTTTTGAGNSSSSQVGPSPANGAARPTRPLSDLTRRSIAITTFDGDGTSSDGFANNGHVPSYIGISCAISGYSSYSRHCSSSRTNLSLASTSPTVMSTRGASLGHPHLAPILSSTSGNGTAPDSISGEMFPLTRPSERSKSGSAIEEEGRRRGDASLLTPTKEQVVDVTTEAKSIVQQRIESLYGAGAVEGWRESRSKQKTRVPSSLSSLREDGAKYRSPSCPPVKSLSSPVDTVSKKSPPVFRHIEKAFLERLESHEEINNAPGQTTVGRDNISAVPPVAAKSMNKKEKNEIIAPSTQQPEQEQLKKEKVASNEEKKKKEAKAKAEVEAKKNEVNELKSSATESVSVKDSQIGARAAAEPGIKNGQWFMSELERTCDGILGRVAETERAMEQDAALISDEVAGNLRAGIGKANLLVAKKLSQFGDLCLKNINQSLNDGFETKLEDLEGFWAMVSYQVDDINHTFDDINLLRENNWEMPTKEPQPKVQPKIRSPLNKSSTPKGSPAKKPGVVSGADAEAAAARDAARRKRLQEAKRRQAEAAAKLADTVSSDNGDAVTIFVSANNRGGEEGAPTEQ